MPIRKTKWFEVNRARKTITSINKPTNLKEAFDKSIKKWEYLARGYYCNNQTTTCGLCNLSSFGKYIKPTCHECPIFKDTRVEYCDGNLPFLSYLNYRERNAELSLLYAKNEVEYLKELKKKYLS